MFSLSDINDYKYPDLIASSLYSLFAKVDFIFYV